MYFLDANNMMVTHNQIYKNFQNGIQTSGSNYLSIIGNNLSQNVWDGINLTTTSHSRVLLNNISKNLHYGSSAQGVLSNTSIFMNYISNNRWSEATCFSVNVTWDNGTLGNFWGDYRFRYPNATKSGKIWNTPYQINTTTFHDRFPLVNSPFTKSLQPPGSLVLSSDAGVPDTDGRFNLSWTASPRAVNYTIYVHSTFITTINASVLVLKSGLTNESCIITFTSNGTYYLLIVAYNDAGNATSNCIAVVVQIPGEHSGINPVMQFFQEYGLYLLVGAIGVVIVASIGIAAKRRANRARSKQRQMSSAETPTGSKSTGNNELRSVPVQASMTTQGISAPAPLQSQVPATATFYCPTCQQYNEVQDPDMESWYSCSTCGGALQLIKACPYCNQPIALAKDQYEYYKDKALDCWNCKNKVYVGNNITGTK